MKNILSALTITIIQAACGGNESNNLPEREAGIIPDSNVNNADGSAQTSDQRATLPKADTAVLNGTWFLVAILPSDTAAGRVPTIVFNEANKTFTGNSGCNQMRGSFTVTDSALQISNQITTTKMACPGYNEEAFLKNLSRTDRHRFENGMLILMTGTTELSRWTRTKVVPQPVRTM